MEEILLTVCQASKMLGISKQAIYKAWKERRIFGTKFGNKMIMLTTSEVNKFKQNRENRSIKK